MNLLKVIPMNEKEEINTIHNNLSINQKIALVILVFFGILIFIYAIFNMNNSLSLKRSYISDNQNQNNKQNQYQQEDSIESLKNKDTDHDGLSDWDEINLYKTSPYLEDSDSDGYNDLAEIEAETNPICPVGRNCDEFISESVDNLNKKVNVDITTPTINTTDFNNANISENNSLINSGNDNLNKIMSGEIEASELRKTLIEFGMDKTILDKFSDEELMKSYKNTIDEK